MKTLKRTRFGSLPKIKYVQIQTHSRCNADCVFCPYIESAHAAAPGRMTDETWQRVLLNLVPFVDGINEGKVCPYLMQEPLIDKTIFAKIADIYRYFPGTSVEVSTNGAALTEKAAEQLFAAFEGKRHDLWISHHGVDQKSLEQIMLIDHEKSLDNIIRTLKLADGRFTIKIRGAGRSHDGKHQYFTREQYHEYWRELVTRHAINPRGLSIDYFWFHDRAGTLHRTDRGANTLNMGTQRQIDKRNSFYCCRLDEWVHFMWDGQIRLCCMDYHGEVKLPNINEVGLLEYFHGPEYDELVEMVSGREDSPENFICKRCTSPGG